MSERSESRIVSAAKHFYTDFGLPRLIIAGFLLVLFALAVVLDMNIGMLVSDSLVRVGMNGILVLSMLFTLACGVGLNFGLAVGVIAGLIGAVTSMNWDIPGFGGFFTALAVAVPIAVVFGWLYAELLDRVKGQEMMVGTYVGYSVVAGMCMFWLLAPYRHPAMIFPLGGQGLRNTITLDRTFAHVLNDFLAFQIGDFRVPTGLLLFFAVFCVGAWLFFRSRVGHAMRIVGANPSFAQSSGVNVKSTRRLGVILSTVLGAVGIVVYAQSYGFVQLYTGPLNVAFPAVASILIGGASLQKASVGNVVLGAILFHTLLTIALPVTQTALQGADISEIARMIMSNGMILYALTRAERR